jgi:Alkylmercury lyase
MSDQAHKISRTTTDAVNSTRRADEDAADVIFVCRSATLRRAEYQFYRAILLAFPARSGPPDRAILHQLARRFAVPLEATLARMAQQDLVQRDPTTGTIRAAYPFSGAPTAHCVTLLANSEDLDGAAAIQLHAMCALDALGIPLMLRRDALVTSVDALTGEAVRVVVRHSSGAEDAVDALENWTADWEPSTAVVFARPEEHECEGGVAAGSCCPLTNFFVTREHAERWGAAHGSAEDVVLSQDEVLMRAATLFAGVLYRLGSADQMTQSDQSERKD